ncbi:bifunctional cobalt-precorrin-7 (C(5))-methyltransferase/cobalt-precorrin-6B (C(15))-methyltransferase [Sulfitobacter donghicola]|uniref:Precorrin-6y methyltransferase n=1 Tax=Sulfitobacter donghicola DSW-25 = KCTC 12864 = JCM 14565 TaxID=1300350 RepID=A0A073IYT0_9RHOB|nr:bifunctional cobalt-precorrin-7 (C(5))-methyltransferase/cobalt-precorrin-6B (C(15))-methyltransferase [Sulfitobacter donghicola]KEJ90512.1 precorrin-6y methyltransferase [Sulfitobacter donghicola DSW-25 = KCTC 12864 = JCM 14565]KIN67754.1 putative Precorrin-6y C5,15-methyltransferase [Sulfitobacter donghicola DSW-25 = KCTC 12864 = JCM 14565]
MSDPWLSIIGLNEDSLDGLSPASRAALEDADIVFGGPRHLELAQVGAKGQAWPIPFSTVPVLEHRGQKVAVLASGDPFWHGAGGSLVRDLKQGEWRAFPAPSTFTLAASVLGWRMEDITCHGLHAAPLARLRGVLSPYGRMICLMRDGDAPAELAQWLCDEGAGAATLTVMECLGGPRERLRAVQADGFDLSDIVAPVAVAVALPAKVGISRASGLPDDSFANDGQITKRPVRALTLSALAPRGGELLWDIGAGSGSISIEWCLAGGRAIAFEQHTERSANIVQNIDDFGLSHRMTCITGIAAEAILDQETPDAVFIGGGARKPLLEKLYGLLPAGTRLVANGVTLETEALLAQEHAAKGGALMRFDIAQATPLGPMRGWNASRPIVQWSVTL